MWFNLACWLMTPPPALKAGVYKIHSVKFIPQVNTCFGLQGDDPRIVHQIIISCQQDDKLCSVSQYLTVHLSVGLAVGTFATYTEYMVLILQCQFLVCRLCMSTRAWACHVAPVTLDLGTVSLNLEILKKKKSCGTCA